MSENDKFRSVAGRDQIIEECAEVAEKAKDEIHGDSRRCDDQRHACIYVASAIRALKGNASPAATAMPDSGRAATLLAEQKKAQHYDVDEWVDLVNELERELADAKDDVTRLHREKMDALFGPDGFPRSKAPPASMAATAMPIEEFEKHLRGEPSLLSGNKEFYSSPKASSASALTNNAPLDTPLKRADAVSEQSHSRPGSIGAPSSTPPTSAQAEIRAAALREAAKVPLAMFENGSNGNDDSMLVDCSNRILDLQDVPAPTSSVPSAPAPTAQLAKPKPPQEIAAEWKDWIPYPDSTQAEWDRYNLAAHIASAIAKHEPIAYRTVASISPDLRDVLREYDGIIKKGDFDPDPEWDFVMRRADYRLIRETLAKLPVEIVNPPKPA